MDHGGIEFFDPTIGSLGSEMEAWLVGRARESTGRPEAAIPLGTFPGVIS